MTKEEKDIIRQLAYREFNYLESKLDKKIEEQKYDDEYRNDRYLYKNLWNIYCKCCQYEVVGILPVHVKGKIRIYDSQG